ncbi:MAG: hypothetical protein AAF363_06310 [Bacteroidota bacterium]
MNEKKPIVLTGSDHLHFEPIDVHFWKVSEDLYVGRPGEKEFRLPQVVINVLNDIRSAKRSPYYRLQEDGRYYIFIPTHNVRGIASWG